jgi:3'-phosphoadenosine 5'-phosphosulfate sulfotransferase (PAPS reductase)/FAD synthetase
MTTKVKHILSLSGGKDSAALAIYMRDRVPEMEYIFHDSGVELPETYAYMERLSAHLGKPVTGGMIPSNHRRWCTRMLKLKPFEDYVGDDPVINYVGIRADEDREGYVSHKSNITTVCPFADDGLVRADIIRILEESGLGLPTYTEWGRTRSGCYFCFYQQKIEWVKLRENHKDLFDKAKEYEYANKVNGNPFFWNSNESLEDLEKPERMEEIKNDWNKRTSPVGASKKLVHIMGLLEEQEVEREGCLICFK